MTCPWKTVTSPRRDQWGPWNTGMILSGRQRGRGEESCGNPRILAQGHKPESVSQPKLTVSSFTSDTEATAQFTLGSKTLSKAEPLPRPGPHAGFPSQEEPRVQLSSARFHTSLGQGVIGEESRELQALKLPTGHTHRNRQLCCHHPWAPDTGQPGGKGAGVLPSET